MAKVVDMDSDDMLSMASQPYVQCETHSAEMMEKSIACLSCSKLVCALCMRDSHLQHEIISVIKLRDCMSLREKVEDDLNELQVLQKRLQTQMEERKTILKNVELSSSKLCTQLESAFDQLQSIIQGKKEEIKKYVTTFRDKNIEHLKGDLKEIEEKYKNSTRMIQKVISCTTKPHQNVKDLMNLPTQLKSMVENSQLLSSVDNTDILMAENKFSKVLPSLQAVSNICQTLHPEATKVVWSKVTPDKKEKDNGTLSSSLKRKSNNALKALKKMKRSPSPKTEEASPFPLGTPEPTPGTKAITESAKPLTESAISHTATPMSPPSTLPTTPIKAKTAVSRSPDTVDRNTRLPDSSTGTPDLNSSVSKEYKMINLDMIAVGQGHFVMGQNGVELNIGKVVEVTRLHSLHFVSVQWYQGAVGKSRQFTVSEKWIKKSDLVNSEGLICSFTFDPVEPIDDKLEKELLRAGQEFNINGSASSPFAKRVRISKPASAIANT